MGSPLLNRSALAHGLLQLAAERASGRVAFGGRTLVLCEGQVGDVLPAMQDDSLERFLTRSNRVAESVLARYELAASRERASALDLLVDHGVLSAAELERARRALLLNCLTRGLRAAAEQGEQPPLLEPDDVAPADGLAPLALAPLLLDAQARAAASADAGVIGSHLNHRLDWLPGPHADRARAWADFGDVPARPAVSTVLAKRPAAAPRIAALLRAGVIRLDPPGVAVPSVPPPPDTLPQPAPRIPELVRAESISPADPLSAVASIRPPRMRLDPGQAHAGAEPLEPTPLPELPPAAAPLVDPLLPLEQHIAELEAKGATGPERARAFTALADVWRARFGSLERACRAFREAAAADPSDTSMLQQAALHCHDLGDHDLAVRYAAGAVAAAGIPIERGAAQRLRARIERSAGHLDACIEALCEAAADDPDNPQPHEQVAALLLERGLVDGANAHARLAAAAMQDEAPERALALLAWAWTLKPSDVPTTYEYASLLDARGLRPGAVAILSDTAQRCNSAEQRRKLRLAAAERAETAGRLELAAELLADAFDAEPHFDLLYAPLEEDLATTASREYRATLLEDLATACAEEQRAHWLTLAGQAMLHAEGQHEAALWLLFEALLAAPGESGALEALRTHARGTRGLSLLAHGLRVAIAACFDEDPRRAEALLAELAELAEGRLANAQLAFAARAQLERLRGGSPSQQASAQLAELGARIEARRVELEAAERALEQARPEQRAERCLEVAGLLPDLPDKWPRKIQLLREALALGAAPEAPRAELETLLGLTRDVIALATFLEDQSELSRDRSERVRLLSRLAEVHTVREDAAAVAAVCETLLALEPGSRIAIARLERAARRLGDPRRLARALALRVGIASPGPERGRLLAQLARTEELVGQHDQAAAHAVAALRDDPSAADAGLVLLRHAHHVEPALALSGLQALAELCGPSRSVLVLQTQAAQACGDRAALRASVERWVEVLPSDAAAHRARVLMRADQGDAESLLAAADAAINAMPVPEVLDAARVALDRLDALDAQEAACLLAQRIAEEQGLRDPELADRSAQLARRAGAPHLLTAALELLVAFVPDAQREAALLELAAHHLAQADAAGEVRALLRVLEGGARPAQVLARLRELFAGGGDGPRLLAAITLMAEGEQDPARHRELLLELATVAGQRLHELPRAEHYVRVLVAAGSDDITAVRAALGALFSLGDADWALERCLAIGDDCPAALASRVHLWCALTAEARAGDPARALEIARAAALRWPVFAEPLLVVERLTLATQDVDCAMQTYDALITAACGPHGRRALVYRAGRWLERAGLPEQALERYLSAFELAPTSGAAFKALQRVARQTGQLARLIPCYERLADQVRENRARCSLLVEAAELCARQIGDAPRSFSLLLLANAASERGELDERLLATALELRARDAESGRDALQQLAEQLEQRAAQLWNGEDKVRVLMRLCTVLGSGLARAEAALEQAEAALAIARQEELPAALQAEAESLRNAALARARRAGPSPRPSPPPAPAESQPAQPEVVAQEPPAAPPETVEQAPPAAALAAEIMDLEPESEPPPIAAPPPPPPTPAGSAAASRTHPDRAQDDARASLLEGPISIERLRQLYRTYQDAEHPAALYVLRQLLGSFDPEIRAPRDSEYHSGVWRGQALREAIGPGHTPELERLLSVLWDSVRVIARFRSPLSNYSLSERDRISRISVGPLAEAYAQAARTLERTDVPVYVLASAQGAIPRTLPTHPPSVLAGHVKAHERAGLQYGMARALWLARPEHVIGGVLPPEHAFALLEGSLQAFAPGLVRGTPSSASKELVAALWQNVPTREQRTLGESLRRNAEALQYPRLRARTRAVAARAALLASGGLRAALRQLASTESELADLDLGREEQFVLGCERCPALAETVRCALSEPYLSALGQTLRAQLRVSRV